MFVFFTLGKRYNLTSCIFQMGGSTSTSSNTIMITCPETKNRLVGPLFEEHMFQMSGSKALGFFAQIGIMERGWNQKIHGICMFLSQ